MLHCPHFDWKKLDLQAQLGSPLTVDDIQGIICGPMFDELTSRATSSDEAVEIYKLLYKMVEEILSLKDEDERIIQHT